MILILEVEVNFVNKIWNVHAFNSAWLFRYQASLSSMIRETSVISKSDANNILLWLTKQLFIQFFCSTVGHSCLQCLVKYYPTSVPTFALILSSFHVVTFQNCKWWPWVLAVSWDWFFITYPSVAKLLYATMVLRLSLWDYRIEWYLQGNNKGLRCCLQRKVGKMPLCGAQVFSEPGNTLL